MNRTEVQLSARMLTHAIIMSKRTIRILSSKEVLELLVLFVHLHKPRPAAGIMRRMEKVGISIPRGTIYALLSLLRRKGFVISCLEELDFGPARVCYSITDRGKELLIKMQEEWLALSATIKLLESASRTASVISQASGR